MTKLIQLAQRMDKALEGPNLTEPEIGEIFPFLDPKLFRLQPWSCQDLLRP